MKYIILPLVFIVFLFIQSCKDSIVFNSTGTPVSYNEILTVNFGEVNIRMLITGDDSLTSGYNDLYMKVKKGGVEQTKGYVKLFPKMWMTPTFMHSTPVSEKFEYDAATGYYKGYAIFNMVTAPPDVVWYGVFTYIDENNVSVVSDTTPMYTKWDRTKQWSLFYDSTSQSNYMFSLVSPFNPVKGMNDIEIMLHKTDGYLLVHEQIKTAQMFFNVYKINSGITSTGNINPVPGSNGIYKGKFNVPDTGAWKVCDSIYYDNHWISNNPPPMPEFYFEIR